MSKGYLWRISNNGILTVGNMVRFGNSAKLLCANHIEIGDYSAITFNTLLMDTNSHFSVNIKNLMVKRREGPIIIGKRNWIGNNSRILKGCHTGDDCLVAAGSMVNHDLSKESCCLLAGSPADIKFRGIKRCFSFQLEGIIRNYFELNPSVDAMTLDSSYEDPIDDLIKFFK